ncbi:hypothetical protein BDY24DRAFT_398644 [Mrakia frigida]|uniref:uncharacterized protein n=1 Tax=Mrakia frigida TaxID=29902 RepID=UPI003FCC0EE4
MTISAHPSLLPLLSSTISTFSLLLASSSGILSSVNVLENELILSSTGEVLRQGVGLWGSCIYGGYCISKSPFSLAPNSTLLSSSFSTPSTSTLPYSSALFVLLLLSLLAASIQNFINLFVFLSDLRSTPQPLRTPSSAKKLSRDVGLAGGAVLGIFIALLTYPSISLHWNSFVGGVVLGSEEQQWRVARPGFGTNLVLLAGFLLIWGGRERRSASSIPPSSPNDLESSVGIEKKISVEP